ncbi:MAG: HEPN domain-containing protein [Saprospiraceae bacterium]|nr:HEPN domain-containing protein [Saprospiraceae bacterium]
MQGHILEDIIFTLDRNIKRLDDLLKLYENISMGKGRKPANTVDLLRATVILTHATLEDFLRNVMIWKLPQAKDSIISKIPLIGTQGGKFDLGELLRNREKTVEELIILSIRDYLNTKSFNNTNDICGTLDSINIPITDEMKTCFKLLDEMIQRRHHIVHQADRDDRQGRGYHGTKSLSYHTVIEWKRVVEKFVKEIIKSLQNEN